jgi:hypothetical protein
VQTHFAIVNLLARAKTSREFLAAMRSNRPVRESSPQASHFQASHFQASYFIVHCTAGLFIAGSIAPQTQPEPYPRRIPKREVEAEENVQDHETIRRHPSPRSYTMRFITVALLHVHWLQ